MDDNTIKRLSSLSFEEISKAGSQVEKALRISHMTGNTEEISKWLHIKNLIHSEITRRVVNN